MKENFNASNQIEAYLSNRKLKFHEIKTIKIIRKRIKKFSGNFLDIGCANGNFINSISNYYKNASFYGIDISNKLISLANKKKVNINVSFERANIDSYVAKKKFDIIQLSGVLSNYNDFKKPLIKCLKMTKKNGLLIIFGCFNSRNVDTITKVRNNYNNSKWQNGLTSYSIHTVGKFIEKSGYKFEFIRFQLPIDIKENINPIRSYTVKTNKNKKIILTGANIVNELFHLIIKK